ncbi:MAG: patatin-like phospholipase family protein [Saprospiraceae bacterium]|nr:patatin-like phospholipase family protein [Saprospiraceae bacterium]
MSLSFKDYKIALPQAFSNGQNAFDFMSELTDRVSGIEEFSQLPVPFLCIGTDVSTGQQVMLERGCLACCMRASGSLPGVLAPVELNGQLITDGGVVNNFPAKEVREKGMDIIIGVTVEAGLYKKEELQSIQKIIEQVGSYQMEARSREQLQYCDLVIRPDISGYGVTSFDATDSLLLRGEQAARKVWDQLIDIARRQQAAAALPARALPLHTDDCPMHINAVYLEPNKAITTRALLKKFPDQVPGEISFSRFRDGIAALYATDNFQYLDYRFKIDSNGIRELYIRPRLKPGYERSLRLGLHFDNVYKSSLLLNGTFRNVLFRNSIASLDCIIGDKLRYNFNYFVDRGRKPGFGFNSRLNLTNLFIDLPVRVDIGGAFSVQKLLFNLTDFTQELYVNLAASNHFATGLAAEVKHFKTATSQAVDYLTSEDYIDEKGWYSAGKAFFNWDSRDRLFFTRSGMLAGIDLRFILPISSKKYEETERKPGWNFDLRAKYALPVSARLTAIVSLNAGITQGTPAPPYRYFIGSNNLNLINNFRPFIGLPFAKISGNHLLQGSIAGQYNLFKNHYLTLSGHLAWIDDRLQPFSDKKRLFRSAGIAYGLDTPLGPVEMCYGMSNRGSELYVNLGYWF